MDSINQYQNICVIRLSAIGDCINAYATILNLKKSFPNAHITWIIGETEANLFKDCPDVELITYNKKKGIKELLRVRKLLKNRKFDVLLDMHTGIKASIISLFVNAKEKYGFDKQRSSDCQFLFVNKQVKSPDSPHTLDGFLAFTQAIGAKNLKPSWDFHLSKEELSFAEKSILTTKNLIITPCTSKSYKNWTIHGYIELAKYAITKGFTVYLCGGKSNIEQETAKEILKDFPNNPNIINLIGKTSLREMLAVISKATIVLSPDSGPVHMANALNIPVIGLYAHHNPKRVGPYNFLNYVVSVYDECVKLEHPNQTQLKWRTRVHDKQAMLKISSSMVKEAFNKILKDFHLE